MRRSVRQLLLAAPLLTVYCGCSSLSTVTSALNPFAESYTVAGSRNPAVEVAGIWQPGEGRNAQGIPARGFSGQVYFFTERAAEPALVDGAVRIYLFADRGTPEERAQPIHQYDFTTEAWQTHATMTSLGPGYAVFVPYPKVEPYQVRCQLRVRFTPNDGSPPIWSEAVTMVLEGPPPPGAEPAWWANLDHKTSPPAGTRHEITHRSGTPGDLAAAEGETKPQRTLRTDTFRFGEVRPVSYERPSPFPATRREPERRESHLLDDAGAHPLSRTETPAEYAAPPRTFLVGDATPVALHDAPSSRSDDYTPVVPGTAAVATHPLAE